MSRSVRRGGWIGGGAMLATGLALFSWLAPEPEANDSPEGQTPRRALGLRAGVAGALELPADAARAMAHDGGVASAPEACAQVRVRERGGRGVSARIRVAVRPSDGTWARRPARRADAEGHVEICAVEGASLLLRARTDEGQRGALILYPSEWQGRVLTLPVAGLARVRGRVLDPDGRALEGARITVASFFRGRDGGPSYLPRDASPVWAAEPTWSDAEGRFEVRILGQQTFQVGAEHDGYARTWSGPFAGRPGATYETEVRMEPARAFDVTITHGGVPLENAQIVVHPTNVHGRFPPIPLPDGHYRLEGQHPDARFDLSASAEGYVWSGRRTLGVGTHEIELARGATVRVDVSVDPALAPCLGAPILPRWEGFFVPRTRVFGRLEGASAGSGATLDAASGTLVFRGVPPGPARLTVSVLGSSEEREVEVRLPETWLPPVRLVPDGDTGVIRIIADDDDSYFAITEEDGSPRREGMPQTRWSCEPLPPGTYRVRAREEHVVHLTAGRVVDVRIAHHERPTRTYPSTCAPPFDVRALEDGTLLVTALKAYADDRVLPGDRILAVEGEEELGLGTLTGPAWSRLRAFVEQPDGARRWVELERVPRQDAR